MVIIFHSKPSISAASVMVGPTEKLSPFKSYFDRILDDDYFDTRTHELAQSKMIQQTVTDLLKKGKNKPLDIDYFLSGDLINQMTPTNFAAREIAISFIGLFSACATSVSSMIIAAVLTELGASNLAIAGASSHHNATEKQFRYPVLYGGQKPGTAQWTVTASGYAIIKKQQKGLPYIAAATVGQVIDAGDTDPFHMGGAMAPAAYSTIERHLSKRSQTLKDYDIVMTGDLGKVGLQILKKCFQADGTKEGLERLRDAGAEFYGDHKQFQAGASGAGCSAAVFLSYILDELNRKKVKRVLLVATGALLSPLSVQQGQSIPCTAHAIEICID